MKRRTILGATGALVATMAITGSAFAATLFTNGSFETGAYVQDETGYGYMTIEADTSAAGVIEGWTVTDGEIDWIKGYWPAAHGEMSIDLNGLAPGAISQTFPTIVNDTYFVSFKLAGNPDNATNPAGAPAIKALDVVATGNATKSFSFDASGTSHDAMGWTDTGYTFVAKGSNTTITFASKSGGVSGAVIDNVVVTQTAATGASCKNGGWKTMADKESTPFKNQGDCVSYYATGEKNLAS